MQQGCDGLPPDVVKFLDVFFFCFAKWVVFFGNWTWLDHIDMSRAGYSVRLEIWTNDHFFQSVKCDDQ